jgi:hypothetical protein
MTMKKIEEIKTHPLFTKIFAIKNEVLTRIEQDMRNSGYDTSQPIILATWEGQEELVVLDGHTRFRAGCNAGIIEVPVFPMHFDTEQSALEYAIRLQSNRRNLSDGDLLQCIEMLHETLPRGGDRKSVEQEESTPQSCGNQNGRSAGAKRTADLLNISARKVEQALTIINKGLPEIKEAVLKDKISINKAYQQTQKQRKQVETALSKENSDDMAIDESRESENDGKDSKSAGVVPVPIPSELVGALQELDGLVEDHAAEAIKRYLESFQEPHEENLPENGEADDEEEWFDPEEYAKEQEDKGKQLENAPQDGTEDEANDEEMSDDEEEYFCIDDYE